VQTLRIGLACAVLVVVVSATACGGSGSAEKKIVFWDRAGDTAQLVTLRVDRRAYPDFLPNPPDGTGEPVWSPDGDAIGFVHGEGLYVTDEAGQKMTSVVPAVTEGEWAWSPDSKRLAYLYNDIGVVRPDGTDRHVLVRCEPAQCSLPAWSPDSKRLAFHQGSRLEVVDMRGERRVLVRCVLADCALPDLAVAAWSPDGTRIALAQENRFGCGLSVVRSDGTQLQATVKPIASPGSCGSVVWSRDGKLLALERWGLSSTAIYRENDRNWRLVRLIDGVSNAAWSPDGRQLAYIDDYSNMLWVAQATGEQRKRVGWAFEFEWSPDGTALAVHHLLENRSVERARAEGPGPLVILVIDVATRHHRQVWPAQGSCVCGAPHWQPR
jgi:Tol biopolymer transport system component